MSEQQKKTRKGGRQGGSEAGRKSTAAASLLAGLSSLGSESILMTDATSPSSPRIGRDGESEGGREARTTKTREGGGEGRTAASMLAGLSSLGSESILMTDATSPSTPRIGRDGGREGGREARTTKTREGGREGRTAASMLAGLSSLGSECILMTDATSPSTPRIG